MCNLHPKCFIKLATGIGVALGKTYAKDGWIVGHGRRSSLGLLDFVLYAEILHIAAAEDDVLVDVVGSSDLVLAIAAAFGTERGDILEGNGGALGVDLMEGSNVSGGWGQEVGRRKGRVRKRT